MLEKYLPLRCTLSSACLLLDEKKYMDYVLLFYYFYLSFKFEAIAAWTIGSMSGDILI